MRSSVVAAITVCTVALAATAGSAHADDNAYVGDLQTAGVPNLYGAQDIRMGNYICQTLHSGAQPDFIPILRPWAPAITMTAQRDICPDTLH